MVAGTHLVNTNTSVIPQKIELCPVADISHWNRLMFFNKKMSKDIICAKRSFLLEMVVTGKCFVFIENPGIEDS